MEWTELVEKAKESGVGKTVLPDGNYKLKVEGTKYRDSSGNPQLIVEYSVVGGPYNGDKVTDFLTFSEKAAGIAIEKITSAGAGPDFFAELQTVSGRTVNQIGVDLIAGRLFPSGKVFEVAAKEKGGRNNFYIRSAV